LLAVGLRPGTTPDLARKAMVSAAKAAGMSDRFIKSLVDRLERNPEFTASGVELSNAQMIAALDDKIRLFMAHIDPVVVGQMSGKDLMIATAVAYDKKRLLQGEPTAIIGTGRREALDKLWPALVAEAERRGLTHPQNRIVDITPTHGSDADTGSRRLAALEK
ncbi:MAG: hypothetical protein WA210_09035, partial [Burkholderiaceae bacterium]